MKKSNEDLKNEMIANKGKFCIEIKPSSAYTGLFFFSGVCKGVRKKADDQYYYVLYDNDNDKVEAIPENVAFDKETAAKLFREAFGQYKDIITEQISRFMRNYREALTKFESNEGK